MRLLEDRVVRRELPRVLGGGGVAEEHRVDPELLEPARVITTTVSSCAVGLTVEPQVLALVRVRAGAFPTALQRHFPYLKRCHEGVLWDPPGTP